jgi:tRNA(fMet)-specific endonuclease VapC
MRARYLLDTEICIYLRKRRPAGLVEKFKTLSPGEAAISVITYGELWLGAHRHRDQTVSRNVEEFTTLVPPLPMPSAAGATYGRILSVLQQQGQVIGVNDLWIAAHAVTSGLVLVTNNLREFRRVPELQVADWVTE